MYLKALRQWQGVADNWVTILWHCSGVYKGALLQGLHCGGRDRHLNQLKLSKTQSCLFLHVYHLRTERDLSPQTIFTTCVSIKKNSGPKGRYKPLENVTTQRLKRVCKCRFPLAGAKAEITGG